MFQLTFEHFQGDPFAQPSRISVRFNLTETGFAKDLYGSSARRLGLEDFLLRQFENRLKILKQSSRGSGKSGVIEIYGPSQKILKRNTVLIGEDIFQVIFFMGLPGAGRIILGKECARLFSEDVPDLFESTFLADSLSLSNIETHLKKLEDYYALSQELNDRGWLAFVADGSVLPRSSGISENPLENKAIPFRAPDDFF